MARGIPDHYRGVDIAYQALAQIINRPKYGGALKTTASTVVTANAETEIFEVLGKGMLYAGVLIVNYTSTQKDSAPLLYADGNLLNILTFEGLDFYKVNRSGIYPLSIAEYDNTAFVYSVGFMYGITFEVSLVVKYLEEHGTTPTVILHIIYAVV